MDDAWWCDSPECWEAYVREEDMFMKYEHRTPLTLNKAILDLSQTKASVWGYSYLKIDCAAEGIARLARLPVH
jgi:hypothetical protein